MATRYRKWKIECTWQLPPTRGGCSGEKRDGETREREKDIVGKEARERRGDRRGVYIYIPGKERGQEADEVESFKRLRTRGSRCELGWRVCGIGVMGQLVSYRGSSVRGTERYSDCARRHRARVARREREIYICIYTALFLGVVCSRASPPPPLYSR